MTKRILVLPDVHGRLFWKEPVQKYIDVVDRVVFLGDYLDPYGDEGGDYDAESIFENLKEIVELKRNNMDKVVLLKGNHDQHYASELFNELAGGTRQDRNNWNRNHEFFKQNKDLFGIIHKEEVNGIPYIFSHAGVTLYWLKKVNDNLWMLPDNKVSIADQDIIDRINMMDDEHEGQELLSVIGNSRSWFGEKTGGVLWADIEEHSIPDAPDVYDLNHVFQVFGHTRLRKEGSMVEGDNLAMIDSRQCFIIDGDRKERIMTVREYEK